MKPFQIWKRSLVVLTLSLFLLSTVNSQLNFTLGSHPHLASALVDDFDNLDYPAGMNTMPAVICDMSDPFCIPWLPDHLAFLQSECDGAIPPTVVNYDVYTASANGESYIYVNQYVELNGFPFVDIDLVLDCGGNGVDGCLEDLVNGGITCDQGAMGAIIAVLEVGELIWSCGDPIPPCVGCDLVISADADDPSCGEDNGRITINASAGTPPYSYSVGGAFSSNNIFQNLTPGTYQVTVIDNADCEETTTVVLQNSSNLVVVISAFPTACNENTGSINLSVSGGNPPYTFTWQPNLGNVEDPSGLAAGFYQVTVTDTDGCTQGVFAQIEVESCPPADNPVCGFDGVEYANPCEATCAGVGFNFGSCEEEPCICTANYIPVCGSDGVTYSNACVAVCAGVTDFVEGECGNDCDCPLDYNPVCGTDGNTYSNACFAECAGVGWELGECEELCICPAIYDPVCGSDGNTYSNACYAECAGVTWEAEACETPCICEALYDPVCGSDGNTYSSSCYAECAGITEFESGVCNEPCICPPVYDPVCGADGVTYPSPCEAQCAGVEWTVGSCTEDCNCPAIYDPVCGNDGNTYYNSCFAECAGAGWSVGVCEEECLCPAIYDPVCGSDGLTYQNICYAECAGVGWEPGICEELCICPAIYDPVCGTDGNTYSNACYASCAGVGSTSGPCYPPGENILCLPWLVDIIKNFGGCGTDEFGGICGQTISLATYEGEVLIVVFDYCDYPFNNGYTETVYNQDGVALDQCERVINSTNCNFFPAQGAIIEALVNRQEIWNCGDGLPECVCDLTFSVGTSIPDCGGDNGSIVITASGGTPPYTYYLGGEASNSGVFTGLAEGVYNIVVTDSGGCTEEVNAVLFSAGYPDCLSGEITILSELNDCTPFVYQVNGTFPNSCLEYVGTAFSSDGNQLFANVWYSTGPPPCTIPGDDWSETVNIGILPAGDYTIELYLDLEFVTSVSVTIEECQNCDLELMLVATPSSCETSTGIIEATPVGGTPPFSYDFGSGFQSSNIVFDLPGGFYEVTVMDSNGCTASTGVIVGIESCPPADNPVCGFDGIEYANPCEATCAGVGFNFGPCEEEPCICTADYIPVCGSDGVTYANACLAVCAGITDFVEGECGNDCDCPLDYDPVCGSDGNTYSNACFAECAGVGWSAGECEAECFCPDIYDPVCGSDGNTYSNACFAECAGVTWEAEACDNPCICEALYDPVCGIDGNTYSNSCYAECAGITEYEPGICNEPCICPPVYEPVCGADGVTYSSSCEAQCAGVEWTAGSCTEDCNCPAIYDPVCGNDGNTYYNSCFAECAGVGWSVGVCEAECFCPDIYDPVCGSDGLTYQNICYAECAGVGWEPGICEEPCICPAIYDPVCGTDGNTYSNACYAACAGVQATSGPCYPPGENILCLPWLVDIIKNFGVCGTDDFGGICGQTISLASYQGEVVIIVFDYCDYPFNSGYTETVYNQDGVALDQCERVINSTNCDFFPAQGMIIEALVNREEIWNCGDGLPACVCDLTFSVSTSIPDCGGDNGSIVITASGGTPPYTYYLGGEAGNIGVFTGLAEGVYNIVVTDSGGCTEEVNAVLFSEGYPYCLGGEINIIGELSGCTPVLYEVSGTFPNSCSELIDTDLLIDGNRFVTNVLVSNEPPPCTTPGDDWAETFNLGILPPGNYTIELRINSELITSTSITIVECQGCDLEVVVVGTPPSCGENNGIIEATPDGGTPPFSYDFGSGFQSSNTLSDLPEGTYAVTVMDAEGCTAQNGISLSCTPVVAPMFYTVPNSIERDVGSVFLLTIAVDDFDAITDLQLPLTWNNDLVTFQEVSGFNISLGLDESSFTTPDSGGPAGQLVLNWTDQSGVGVTLPDGAALFSITFLAVAEGVTDLAFEDIIGIPTEITGTGGVDFDLQATNGLITIVDPNTGPGDTLTFIMPDIVIEPGESFCLPVTVEGFQSILSMQGSINFNPGVLSFSGFQNFNPAVTGFGPSSFGILGNGNLTYTWIDFLQNGIDLPDGSTLLELCFTAIGEEESEVVFSGTPTSIEVTNGEENSVPFQSEGSTVSFVMEEPGMIDLSLATTNACAGEVFCLDVTADNFTNIAAFAFPVIYDPMALAISQITNFNSSLGGFASGSVNTENAGEIAVDWEAVENGASSLDPSSLLFTICFEKLTNSSTEVEIASTANTTISVTDGNGDPVLFTGPSTTITSDGCVSSNDQDNDGYSSEVDCDDTNPEINPGADEIPGNDVDENCDDIIGTLPTDVLTFIGGSEVGGVGDTLMIPITVQNFTNISGFQFTMVIPEPDQGTFVEFVEGTAITGISVNPANGIFRAIWNIALGAPPVDLPDNTIIFWVKIALTGEPGECSIFSFSNFPTPISAVEGLDNSFVPITLSGTFCVRETVDITGILQTEYDLPVSGAEVECSDGQIYTTDADGTYTFTELPADADYVIEPHRDIEHPAGVTVGDVVLTRAHIIGLQDLDSPYKIIAADANADDIVTVLDLITLQRVIIGFLDTFPNNESWRFIPESYDFVNPLFPLLEDFPESLQLPALMDDVIDGDFVSIKVGDVNEDVILPLQNGFGAAFSTIEQEYLAGETLTIPVYLPGEKPPAGWQIALGFDADQLQILDVLGPDGQALTANQLHLEKERLRAIWYEPNLQSIEREYQAPLLQIVVQTLVKGKLINALGLELDANRISDRYGTETLIDKLSFTAAAPLVNKLSVGTCYPVPFRERCTFTIESGQREWATLQLVSPDGAMILQRSKELLPGVQNWQISWQDLPASGLYFYHLQSPSGTFTGKLIHNR